MGVRDQIASSVCSKSEDHLGFGKHNARHSTLYLTELGVFFKIDPASREAWQKKKKVRLITLS